MKRHVRPALLPAPSAAPALYFLSIASALLLLTAVLSPSLLSAAAQTTGSSTAPDNPALAHAAAFTGAWSLNKDLSDQPQPGDARGPDQGDGAGPRGRRGGSGGGFGGRGGGGFGGRRGGGFGGRAAAVDPQQAERLRQAMRDITNPPEHLTIVTTDSMIILTGADGRTARLSPDGKKIKDENTNVERKTKWDGDKLVSEISGLGNAKITESYAVDAEHHQLRVTTTIERGQGTARTITHVYDQDKN